MQFENVVIDTITVSNRLRSVDAAKAKNLSDSIKEVGLLSPIILHSPTPDILNLVAGAHRIEAAKLIGWNDIDAYIMEGDELHAQLAEIDENLMRSELTQTQVGEHNKRRREIWAAMKEEEKTGGNDGSTCLSDGRSSGPQHEKGFAQETAESTGQTKQHVNKTISRVEKVCQEARDIIRGTKADTGAFLDQLAKMGDDDQVQTAQDKVDAIDRKERDEEFKEQEKRRKREAKEKQGAAFREFMNTMRPKFNAREWLELVRLLDDAQRKVSVSDMREYEDM